MGVDFIKYRALSFGLSAVAIVATLVLCYCSGIDFGVDFTGGVVCEVRLAEGDDIEELRQALGNSVSVQSFREGNSGLVKAQSSYWPAAKKVLNERGFYYGKIDYVGAQLSETFINRALMALATSFLGVYLYLLLRFDHAFGLSGVIALIHDCILILGFLVATGIEVNLPVLTAFLTIIGYSINDSVVIFDRIRENMRGRKSITQADFNACINESINGTLSRTLYTSVTTLLAAATLIIFDAGQMREFSLIISFGVIIGTYSSIFVATPLYILIKSRSQKFLCEPD